MKRSIIRRWTFGAAVALAAGLAVSPLAAGGFAVPGQGGKALGMAGAFVAQADDPTAVYFNPGGLFQVVEQKLSAGLATYVLNEGLYQGLSPGAGAGTAAERDTYTAFLPHAYYIQPLGESENLKLGVGLYSPFWLDVEWLDPGNYAGRFVSTVSQLETYDTTAQLGFQLGQKLGIGFGAILRISQMSLARRLQLSGIDVATQAVESDTDTGLGWNAGLLYKASERLNLALTYRSAVDVDHGGVGRLTQIEVDMGQIDELVRATFPLDQDLATSAEVRYPDQAVAGAAFKPGPWVFELDVEWTGWSRFQQLAVEFLSEPDFSTTHPQSFDDTLTFRLGTQYTTRTGSTYRAGVAFDESPQPDQTVGPFLADADQILLSVGFSRDWLDLAFTWVDVDRRTVTNNLDDINGSYRSSAWMVALTLSK